APSTRSDYQRDHRHKADQTPPAAGLSIHGIPLVAGPPPVPADPPRRRRDGPSEPAQNPAPRPDELSTAPARTNTQRVRRDVAGWRARGRPARPGVLLAPAPPL